MSFLVPKIQDIIGGLLGWYSLPLFHCPVKVFCLTEHPFFQDNQFGYYRNERMQVLRMEYKRPGIALYIFLPRLVQGLEQIERKLTPDILLAAYDAASKRKQNVEVSTFWSSAKVSHIAAVFRYNYPNSDWNANWAILWSLH